MMSAFAHARAPAHALALALVAMVMACAPGVTNVQSTTQSTDQTAGQTKGQSANQSDDLASRPGLPAQRTESKAMALAEALAQADTAAKSGDAAGLAQPLAMIAALGARPLDPAGAAALADWQARNPDQRPPLRGRALGPGYRNGMLGAGADLRIDQLFLSGQKASIALSSPDGAPLRLQVIDGDDQPVCQHTAARPSCEWIPIFTQRHAIHLINPGRREARFYLVIE